MPAWTSKDDHAAVAPTATPPAAFSVARARFNGRLLAAATAATLLMPFVLPYTRAVADGLLAIVVVLFLARCWSTADWRWLRTPWTRLALLFWVWMLVCTLIAGLPKPIEQAVLALRFFLFVPALENWVLRDPRTRQRLWYAVLAVAIWIAVESWQQSILGVNLFGAPRWPDGALTGPFPGPTAGPTYLWVFFPAFLPLCLLLLKRPRRIDRAAGIALLCIAAATMILIGQRMPTLLLALGLCASGLLVRQFRLPVVLTLLLGGVVLILLPILSPPVFAKLVVRFTQQMGHFWATPYGLIFGRAVTMVQAHPWVGLGWDGYRDNCMNPTYLGGVSWLPVSDPTSPEGCNIHPHSYWLQIGTSAGLPGVALFAALIGVWLWRIHGGSAYLTNDRRLALLVMVFVAMWPIASATSLFTVPNAGWAFLMAGWGLAEARARTARA